MNSQLLQRAGIDYDSGVKRFMGRAHLYEKALSKFPKDASFGRMKTAYEAEDSAGLFAAAHEFRGMCGNLALTALYEKSGVLVELLRGGEYTREAVGDAYERLAAEYKIAYDALAAAMEE